MSTELTPDVSSTSDVSQEQRLSRARAALKGVEMRIGAARPAWDQPALPLASELTSLLPEGLKRGQVVTVTGATSLMLALAAQASAAGSWTAAIGMPTIGVVSAARRGIALERLALIPHPGAQAVQAVSACVEGVDVVLLGERLALSDTDRRRLAARAKERGSLIVAAGPWQGAHVNLTVERSVWRGLGAGDGRLRSRELTVAVGGRRQGALRRVRVVLDSEPGMAFAHQGMRADVDKGVA